MSISNLFVNPNSYALSANSLSVTERIQQQGNDVSSPYLDQATPDWNENVDAVTPNFSQAWAFRSHDKSTAIAYGFGQNISAMGNITIDSGGNFQTSDLLISTTTYTVDSGLQKKYLVQAFVEFTLDNTEAITFELNSTGTIRTTENATSNSSGAALEYGKLLTGILEVGAGDTPTVSINVSALTTSGSVGLSAASYLTITEL